MSNFIDSFLDESEPWENWDYSEASRSGHDAQKVDGVGEVTPLSVRLSDDLIEKLQERAVSEGVSFSAYVNKIASDFRRGHGDHEQPEQ